MCKIKLLIGLFVFLSLSTRVYAEVAVGTETILHGFFGVNLHMSNCCNGNYGDTNEVISQIKYIGARRLRDWPGSNEIMNKWVAIHKATGATFHAALPQSSPARQRIVLEHIKTSIKKYPNLIDVIEGSNEPDTEYPASQGASLEDSALLQEKVYEAGKELGVKVAQLSVGGGWIPPFYEGNYKKFGTPPADYGNAHVYMTTNSTPALSIERIGNLAAYSVGGKPVDVTEFGTYKKFMDDKTANAYIHLAPFDAYLLKKVGLFVYALHDDMSGVIGFYDENGNKRDVADYWHHTTKLLSDPNGKELPTKNIDIKFTNKVMAGSYPLGIKNIVMYKSDGSIWIVVYDEEKVGAPNGSETIILDGIYKKIDIFDGRNGNKIRAITNTDTVHIDLPPNHLFIVSASN